MFSCRVWRDDGLTAPFRQPIAQPPCVIGTVCQQTVWGRDACQEFGHTGQVMRLARRQAKRDGAPERIGQGMNLGRPSAA